MAVRKVHKPTVVVHCMDALDGKGLLCGMEWYHMPPGHGYIRQDAAHQITCSDCRAELARLALEASGER